MQLVSGDIDGPNKIIQWQNPRTSSPRYCRPIKIQFIHETINITSQEKVCIENQIEKLQPSIAHFNDTEIMVKHILMFTMIDGKVCNSVTSTKSAMRCYIICGSTSKDLIKIEIIIYIKTNDLNLNLGFQFCMRGYDFLSVCYICHTKSVSKSGKRVEMKRKEKF